MTTTFTTKREEVLSAVPEADRNRVAMLANYRSNTSGGERPSDSARWAVRQYEAGRLDSWEQERAEERARIHRTECMMPRCGRCAEIEENGRA